MATRAEIVAVADRVFDSYDKDNSGFIDQEELRTVVTTLFKQISHETICT